MTQEQNRPVIGILINNLGTPASYKTKDVRIFLRQFLSDPRVIKVPRIIWWFILNGFILTTRPKKSGRAYQKVWTEQGSPLLSISNKLLAEMKKWGAQKTTTPKLVFEIGMRYGSPSIEQGLNSLRQQNVDQYLILPMYPQYSYTTTASVKDEVKRVFASWENSPESSKNIPLKQNANFKIICDYHNDEGYIAALADSVQQYWDKNGRAEKLVMSFHGIPQAYSDDGDPYQGQCEKTAELLAAKLSLKLDKWQLTFQSRLGPKKWLEPYTDLTLRSMASQGVKSVDLICPGFSVDCLETLEEIAMENKQAFIESGGTDYNYIPCLNDSQRQVEMLGNLIQRKINKNTA